jgi:ribosome maturation factor RimP
VSEPFFYEVFLDNREKLDFLIAEACRSVGVELVELDQFQAGKRKVLRLYVDKPEGVTIGDCTEVSRNLSAALDLDEEIIAGAYTLEVSSPGLDRPLKSTADFQRNIGRFLRITRSTGKPVTGILVSVEEQNLTLDLKGHAGQFQVPRSEILSAKVDIQF